MFSFKHKKLAIQPTKKAENQIIQKQKGRPGNNSESAFCQEDIKLHFYFNLICSVMIRGAAVL